MRKTTSSDVYNRYHQTPGDTSEGLGITVLFSLLGCLLCAASFLLYIKFQTRPILLAAITIVDLIFTYVEINHLFIRKYWFREHRRMAVILSLVAYWILAFVLVICVNHFALSYAFAWKLAWIPCFLMPPIIVVILIAFCLLYIMGN